MTSYRALAAIGVLLLSAPAVEAEISFSDREDYPVVGRPSFLATADFDGVDGLDVTTGTSRLPRVAFLLNEGDGTFRPHGFVTVPSQPVLAPLVLSVDVDGVDGPDVATVNQAPGTVSVLRNLGDATFAPPETYPVGIPPFDAASGVAAADFDGINGPDIAATYQSFSVLAGNGASVLLNRGDGTFSPAVNYPVGVLGLRTLTAADLDGFNGPDLAVANRDGRTISVFFNRGDGTFGSPLELPAPGAPLNIIAADLDGVDGPDLATVNFFDTVNVLLNRGDGTFFPALTYPVGGAGTGLATTDVDGDGDLDLIATNFESDDLSVLRNQGDGTFLPFIGLPVGSPTAQIVAADLDGAAGPDLALTVPSLSTVSVLLNLRFSDVPGDLDADGDVDLDDLWLLLERRGEPASGPGDPADLDRDGLITGLDARRLVLLCTRFRCAI